MKYKISSYSLTEEKIRGGRFRFVMISDLHNEYRPELPAAVEACKPDFIIVAGDAATHSRRSGKAFFHNAERMLHCLAESAPLYFIPGNHELRMGEQAEIFRRLLEKNANIRWLSNETMAIKSGKASLQLAGLFLPRRYYRAGEELTPELITQLLGQPRGDEFCLLVAHTPQFFPAYASWGADLTLSGHLHGGVARIPGLGGVVSPYGELFPRYDRGLFKEHGKSMIVSAGAGMHTVPVRIMNPREIVEITLRGADE